MGGVKVLGVSLLLAKNDLWPTWVTTGNVTTTEPSEITFRGSILYRERLDSSGEKMAYQGPKLTKLFQLIKFHQGVIKTCIGYQMDRLEKLCACIP